MKKKKRYHVWTCKIVVDGNFQLPNSFDYAPRQAAIDAVESKFINVLGCFSGWGGQLTRGEEEAMLCKLPE